jgi:hypothetical protein
MRKTFAAATVAFLALAGCRTAQVESDVPGAAQAPEGAASAIVPSGTELVAELDQSLSAKDNDVNDTFTATVTNDVSANGVVVVPQGSKVTGRITGVDGSDRVGDQAALRVAFESIEINGMTHAFSADVTDVDVSVTDRARIGDTTEKAAIGAAAGAAIGAIIGGSLRDALLGGVLGAGAGTIISLGVGDVESALPRGSELTLRTTQNVAAR